VFLAGKISRKNGQDKCLLKEIQLEAQSVLSQSKFFPPLTGLIAEHSSIIAKNSPVQGIKKGCLR
jgi:hypothetical protein